MATLQITSGATINHWDDWPEFKKWIDGTYAHTPFTWSETENTYELIAVDNSIYRTVGINKGSDYATDFEANWKQSIPIERRNSSGDLIVSTTYATIDDSGRFIGQSVIVASGQTTTIGDYYVDADCKITGAHFWTKTSDSNFSSTADFQVVDKDDVLGYFQYLGLQEGDVLELTKYVDKSPIAPGFNAEDFFSANYASIVSGLYLRCTVDNNSSDNIYVGITYIVYKE